MEDRERAQDRVGDQVAGRYRLTRLLGAGGMGAVYEATHEFTQRRVAVKLMHPAFARSRQAAERFVREARAPSSIGHPGIVEVLDGGYAEDGSLYLVLELLEGETLAARMRGKRWSPAELGAIAIELLDALEAAHAAGFVHRDIKPENIFLSASGDEASRVTLLDFGIASVLSVADSPGLTQAGAVLGTPLYMSPEQALGRRIDGRSDLWSVGAICYQALTGQPPFVGNNSQALMVSIATEEHLPLSVASPELPLRVVKVVERALHKQPDKRWQSAAEMADALRQALAGGQRAREPVAAPPRVAMTAPTRAIAQALVAAAPEAPQTSQRSGAALWVGLSGGVALLAALGALFVREPDPQRPSLAAGALVAAPATKRAPAKGPLPAHEAAPAPTAAAEPPAAHEAAPTPAQPAVEATNAEPAQPTQPAPPTPPPAPVAAARIPNSLDGQALGNALHEHQNELQRCYEDVVVAALLQQGQAAQPTADPGALRLDAEIEIKPTGEVREVTLRGAAPDAMRDCARNAIRAWRFPTAAGPTSFRVPLVFQPNIVRQ